MKSTINDGTLGRILKLLEEGPSTSEELAAEIDKSIINIGALLRNARRYGHVVRYGKIGRFHLYKLKGQ